jgi:hypothetical protein
MYYKHSGRFSLGGLITAAFVGVGAALVAGWAYGRGIPYIPEVKLAALATVAFGCLVGAAAGYGLVWGKVRNEPLSIGFAGAVSVLALYLSWAVWVAATLDSQHVQRVSWVDLAAQPVALWNVICMINQYGTWGLSGESATNGLLLWIIWVLEAVTVIGCGVFVGKGVLNQHPFCETCEAWCGRGVKAFRAAPPDAAQLKLQLEANDFRALETLGPANKAAEHLIVEMDACEHCRQFHTVTITRVTVQRTKKGKVTFHHRTLLRQLLIGAGHAEVIRGISDKAALNSAAVPKVKAAGTGKI